ncbi:efflux transporter outer membrane subunit [Pseudomonas sp.]|uniref:efflux transporter outer membrane subunit n=1 Tax=Pseudomonas sp. TaxID=306 RepID=UPI00289EF06B|nr:efflux transporter outer membrane subunit [Pseudomonas sp.]
MRDVRFHPLLLALAVSLAACVPPKKPLPPEAAIQPPGQWRVASEPASAVRSDWWRNFNDPQLTRLVETALEHNTDVLAAISRVDAAREQIALARSALFPSVNASVATQTNRNLGTLGITHTRSAQPQVQIAYELDVWGRLRTLEQAARLQYQASQTDRDAVLLTVASTTARAYITLLSLDAQLQVTHETAESRLGALKVAEDRAGEGYTSELELTQAQSEYEAAMQMIPQLQQAIRRQENAIQVLTGALPAPVNRGLHFQDIHPPRVPGVLPSELLRRRPDVARAEQQLAASDLNLEARRDEFLPQVQLSGSVGRLYVNSLNYDPIKVWSLGASILAPIFTAGRLEAQVNIATAQRDQAAYAYRAAARNAFADVENALSGVTLYAEQIDRIQARQRTLARSLEIARDRYRSGYSSYLDELDAQRNLFNLDLAAVQVRESQLNNVISLYQALGGGWTPARD